MRIYKYVLYEKCSSQKKINKLMNCILVLLEIKFMYYISFIYIISVIKHMLKQFISIYL